MSRLLLIANCFLLAAPLSAAEISSNATGGGPWSDPATWRGKVVPGPGDDAVIQKHDVVVFDRDDDGKVTCKKLQIDPKGVLLFKTGAGKIVCSIAETIESFGAIKLDGTKSAKDFHELRLVGDTAEKRKIKLAKGSALLLYGRPGLPKGACNVALSSSKAADAKEGILGLVEGDGVVMIDWQRAQINDVRLMIQKIDNTGAKPNERLNLIENRFTGQGRIWVYMCDTPLISKNVLEYQGPKPIAESAIFVSHSPLAEIKGNIVRGGFAEGISANYAEGQVLIGNTIEKCGVGITGGGTLPNTMIKQTLLRDCEIGIKLSAASGVIEDTVIEGAMTGLHLLSSNLQITHCQVKNLKPKGQVVLNEAGTLSLLNCNILPDQIKIVPAAAAKVNPVTCLQYLVVAVKDAPVDSLVEVVTNPAPAADSADANVRNSPAPITADAKAGNLTPLPKTLNPLIVKAWGIDLKGAPVPAPEYTIKVLGPAAKEGAARPVLKMVTFRPAEGVFRSSPIDPIPTVEISLK